MFNKISRAIVFVILINSCCTSYSDIFPINLFWEYDVNLRTERWECEKFEECFIPEFAVKIDGRNSDHHKVNVLQIWQANQDALSMLQGFDSDSKIGQFASQFNFVTDDGNRGHLLPTATLEAFDFAFVGQYYLPHDFYVSLFLPFYSMRLVDVQFKDLTEDNTFQDEFVKENLTNNIAEIANQLGGIQLKGWKKAAFGDLVALIEWSKNFPQAKPLLKNVFLDVRAGLTIPTGLRRNEDELFPIPFGNDGSTGLLFGGGIGLRWGEHARVGLDAEFLKLFGTTKERRIKTDIDQTEFLLLAKVKTFKSIGLTQRFNIYMEAHKFMKGLSFRLAYQFFKHFEDRLWLCTNEFSDSIANTAQSLQDWSIHQLLFILTYDFKNDFIELPLVVPQISLFYKFPFNGIRSVQASTLGLSLSLSF